jgi:hypothetical protein
LPIKTFQIRSHNKVIAFYLICSSIFKIMYFAINQVFKVYLRFVLVCKKNSLTLIDLANFDMLPKPKPAGQFGFFNSLANQIDLKHPLCLLSNHIDWSVFDSIIAPKWVNLPNPFA